MTLVLALDNAGGRTFAARRQSRDEALCRDLVEFASAAPLVVTPETATLFADGECLVREKLFPAERGEIVFSECEDVSEVAHTADRLVLYFWNRAYPCDKHTKVSLAELSAGMTLESRTEFGGKSHETITREVYQR